VLVNLNNVDVNNMMQQIAAPKTDIATSTTPQGIPIEPAQGDAFSAVMQDANRTAFEQAKEAAAARNGGEKLPTASSTDDVANGPAGNTQAEAKQSNESGLSTSEHTTNERNESESRAITAGESESSAANSNVTTADEGESTVSSTAHPSEVSTTSGQASTGQLTPEQVISERVISEQIIAAESQVEQSLFNYVDFVSQVRDLNEEDIGQPVQISDIKHQLPVQSNETVTDQIVLSNEQRLQTNNPDKPSLHKPLVVSPEELSQQVAVYTGVDSLQQNEYEQTLEFDKDLLTALFKPAAIVEAEVIASDINQPYFGDDTSPTLLPGEMLEGQLESSNLRSGIESPEAKLSVNVLHPIDSSVRPTDVDAEILLPSRAVTGDMVERQLSGQQASGQQASQVSIEKSFLQIKPDELKDSSKKVLDNIGVLSEQAEADSLKNLTQRVAQIVTEVVPDTPKGNEFIAALKAGVKEFKAQLADGREPGIDLKSLVYDAAEKVGANVSPQQITKLEPSMQQFASLLNVAVNAQQQNQQAQPTLYSASDSVAAESLSPSVGETSKTGSQQMNNAALDKAINITKPDGQQQMVDRVRWMINGRNGAAEIRLDPPELGAMQVRINMSGDSAAVSFIVQSQQAKDVLDMAVPKLRELFDDQGIELGQSSVQQESSGNGQGDSNFDDESESTRYTLRNTSIVSEEESNVPAFTQRISGSEIGGIDFYA